ncbi:MAG: hypothetical protein WCP14_03800 [bacterium]
MVPIYLDTGVVSAGRIAVVTALPICEDGNFSAITTSRRVELLSICDRVALVNLSGELCVASTEPGFEYLLMLDARIVILGDQQWAFIDNIPTAN